MATDLLAMRTEIQEHGFTDTSTARLNALINDAYYDVVSRLPWKFLEAETTVTLTSGSSTPASAPADLRAVMALVNDAANASVNQVLMPERWEVLAKQYAGQLTVPGAPVYYYFVGATLRTFPPADGNYTLTLKYLKYPVAMSNDADLPLIPERHRRVIVLGALVAAYRMEDDAELAQVFENQFESRIVKMVEDLERTNYDRPEMIYDLFYADDYEGF